MEKVVDSKLLNFMDMKLLKAVRFNKATGVAGLLFMVTVVAMLTLAGQPAFDYKMGRKVGTTPGVQEPHLGTRTEQAAREKAVHGLIEAIRKAAKLAGYAQDEITWFTAAARAKWNEDNPCMSRKEMPQKYARRKSVRDLAPNPHWKAVLKEYAKLHRACTHRTGDLTEYFAARNSSVDCKFMVVDTENVGLGNRILMIAAAVVYAVLTQRVLIIPGSTVMLPGILCEPFQGSSWMNFDPLRGMTPYRAGNAMWNTTPQFHSRIDEVQRSANPSTPFSEYAVANGDGRYVYQPDSRFYCDTEQKYYEKVTWVYINGCLYFLPKLFAIPSFRPVLDALFPDRMVLTRVLRDVLLPSDSVWARVKRIDRGYLQKADRRLGVQVRYRQGRQGFSDLHNAIDNRVLQCAIENDILPAVVVPQPAGSDLQVPTTSMDQRPPAANSVPRLTAVFIASLYEGMSTFLTQTFLRYPTTTGEAVAVVQLSHEGAQLFGTDIDQEALAEVLTLSFSDYLFVTPISTFSGISQAYGGLLPWFIDFRATGNEGACTRAQTVDVCFQVPYDTVFQCPYDPAVHNKSIPAVFPDIRMCLDVDTWGMQLVTRNELEQSR